jgi:dihydroflavonol-4-reductase
MKKNILITGASGFIGGFLVEEALKRNFQTFAGIRNTSSRKYLTDPQIHFLELDFSKEFSLENSLRDAKHKFGEFDYIIHNAGITRAKDNETYDRVNFQNTQRFVEALQQTHLVPKKFIYISSLASFGPGHNSVPIACHHNQQPVTAYGRSKLKAEQYLYATKDFPFLIINPTAVYGPREKDVFILLQTINKHLEVYIGSSRQLLSFVHVQDLCEAIFLSMESPVTNQNMLVSDLNVYTAKTFNSVVKESLHKKTVSVTIPVPVVRMLASITEKFSKMSGQVPFLNRERLKEFEAINWGVDCKEITQLGYTPKFCLEEGMKHTIAWYKEHGWIKN